MTVSGTQDLRITPGKFTSSACQAQRITRINLHASNLWATHHFGRGIAGFLPFADILGVGTQFEGFAIMELCNLSRKFAPTQGLVRVEPGETELRG